MSETQEVQEEFAIPKVREPEEVTPAVADQIVEEVLDLGGRRAVPLPDGRTLYIHLPDAGEDRVAEEIYSKSLYRYKREGVPFIAEVAHMVLESISEPITFGKRERKVINQKEIDKVVEQHRIIMDRYDKDSKKNKDLTPPELPDAPEPIVDEGSPALKEVLESQSEGPFTKTNAIMQCLSNTEFSNLIIHSAEYLAGRERSRFVVSQIVDVGEQVGTKIEFTSLWKKDIDKDPMAAIKRMSDEKPEVVGYLEGMYVTYQQEVLMKNFLQKLSSDQNDGNSKK